MLNAPRMHRYTLPILLFLNALSIIAMQFLVPAMPDLQEIFETTPSNVQLTLTVFMFGYAFAQLFYGPLSDRFGRRPILLISLIFFIIGSVVSTFAFDITTLIFGRFIQAIGAAAGFVLPPAVARDVYGPYDSGKAISWISIAAGLAALIAPFAGGLIHENFGWRVGMALMGVIGLIIILIANKYLNESHEVSSRKRISFFLLFKTYKEIIFTKHLVSYLFALALVNGVFYAFFSGGAFIAADHLKISPSDFGLIMIPVVVFFVPSAYLSVRLSRYLSPVTAMLIGSFFTLMAGIFLFTYAIYYDVTVASLLIASAFLGWGNGQVIPIATAEAINLNPTQSGAVSAALGTASMLAGGIASLVFGYFYDGSPISMIILMMIMAFLTVIFCFKLFLDKKVHTAR